MKVNKTKYQNSVIRDMDFLINSESVLIDNRFVPILPNKITTRIKENSEEILCQLDNDPNVLIQLNTFKDNLRLGKYCEQLFHVYFLAHPQIELIECNWQINRKGITVGEIDFIIQLDNEFIGIESAFKCYGQFGSRMEDYEGPKRKDALVHKMNKVNTNQLPLFQSEEVLRKYGEIDSYFHIKGHLFSENKAVGSVSGLKGSAYRFLFWDEYLKIMDMDCSFFVFPKKAWVSDLNYSDKSYKVDKDNLEKVLKSHREYGKSIIIGTRSKGSFENYLMVDKGS